MNRDEQFRRNNDLFELFMQQILDEPELLNRIPDGADIIFLPDSDPALREANQQLGMERERQGATITYVRIEMVPQLRTIFVPRLNIVPAAA
jgi:hypothetical protein